MDQSQALPVPPIAKKLDSGATSNIIETVFAADNLSTFASAIQVTGLIDTLTARGPFTVFAPTDEAFKKLPAGAYDKLLKTLGKLKAILTYHVISGYFEARDIKLGEVMTQQGTTLIVGGSASALQVNEANVTQADIAAANGIVHVIDAVILPKNWRL
ncbi:MAG TPA: fasciclin domain-containing protein [Steroidobacteraceae bacterium]|nr:fasciclin domain-containing protein [Steroidobacteraceae bacterium]